MSFGDPRAAAIARFLERIGLPLEQADVGDGTFLPGIRLAHGGLLVDEARLRWPGDLLHEAGHLAVIPAAARAAVSDSIDDVPGVDTSQLEWAAIAWSYAAALEIGLDPREVFHEGGYRGRGPALLRNFELGVPIGAHLLEAAGMTATGQRAEALGVPPYPHMLRWLRD